MKVNGICIDSYQDVLSPAIESLDAKIQHIIIILMLICLYMRVQNGTSHLRCCVNTTPWLAMFTLRVTLIWRYTNEYTVIKRPLF